MSERPAIMTRNLTRRFDEILAVAGLTLEIYYGEVFGFLGHNGAGKTTTVRLLNGVLAPSGSSARVLGLYPVNDGPSLRRRTGVLTKTPSLDERLTGRENLQIYAELSAVPGGEVAQRVHEFVDAIAHHRTPAINVWEAVRYMAAGVMAHKSALKDGEVLSVPDWGDAPR